MIDLNQSRYYINQSEVTLKKCDEKNQAPFQSYLEYDLSLVIIAKKLIDMSQ